ncbi:hypothetical protein Lser_V15G38617 [Lactuca serriola]
MARVSKTNPFHARRLAEARANNEGQEQREESQTQSRSNNEGLEQTQTESNDKADEKSSESSGEEWQGEVKKRKRKSPMEKAGKRGRATAKRGRGRATARKTTFAVRMALYEQEEMAKKSDPKGKGKEKMQETDEYEEHEACKGNSNGKYMDDKRDKDDDVMPGLMNI